MQVFLYKKEYIVQKGQFLRLFGTAKTHSQYLAELQVPSLAETQWPKTVFSHRLGFL